MQSGTLQNVVEFGDQAPAESALVVDSSVQVCLYRSLVRVRVRVRVRIMVRVRVRVRFRAGLG